MGGALGRMVLSPSRRNRVNGVRKIFDPFSDHACIRLQMKLHAVRSPPDPERLVLHIAIGGKVDCAFGQAECIVMPLENRKRTACCRQHRVGETLIGRRDLMPAELGCGSDMIFSAIGAGQQLAAKTNAQNRPVSCAKTGHQAGELRQPRANLVSQRILRAAKHDNGIVIIGSFGKRVARPGPDHVNIGARFIKGLTDPSK